MKRRTISYLYCHNNMKTLNGNDDDGYHHHRKQRKKTLIPKRTMETSYKKIKYTKLQMEQR